MRISLIVLVMTVMCATIPFEEVFAEFEPTWKSPKTKYWWISIPLIIFAIAAAVFYKIKDSKKNAK